MATTERESAANFPPAPGAVQPVSRRLRVELGGEVVADTIRGVRIVEKDQPPVYYFPPEDVRQEFLVPEDRTSTCEYKGVANYWGVRVGDSKAEGVIWSYQDPKPGYEAIEKFMAFYTWKMDAAFVDDLPVTTPKGDGYGGWQTADVEGSWS